MPQLPFSPVRTRQFRSALLEWFDAHKRDLPWRRTRDPYAIWVSEIMLQQTRVAAVLDHYARFLLRFPTIAALAAAGEDEVLTHWSGLGYYRRARFLHQGARAVVHDYGGRMPQSSEGLRKLPGIGEYTSAAIASIAFGEPIAVVDGNVERVVLRLLGPETKGARLQAAVDGLLDRARPGDFNQAMMELGATVCLPRNPLCLHCPVRKFCHTRGEHPVAPRKPIESVAIAYALARRVRGGAASVLLLQRPQSATVMPGMWELPQLDGSCGEGAGPLIALRHAIMQTSYRVAVFESDAERSGDWIEVSRLATLPLTGLARKILKRLELL